MSGNEVIFFYLSNRTSKCSARLLQAINEAEQSATICDMDKVLAIVARNYAKWYAKNSEKLEGSLTFLRMNNMVNTSHDLLLTEQGKNYLDYLGRTHKEFFQVSSSPNIDIPTREQAEA